MEKATKKEQAQEEEQIVWLGGAEVLLEYVK